MTTLLQTNQPQKNNPNSQIFHRPEIQLLLYCSRTCINAVTAEKIQKLSEQELDWNYLLRIAARNEIIPLLYQSLKLICPKAVPKNILHQLQQCFQANASRNMFLTTELLKLLDLFAAQNISAIPFKGPVFGQFAYGSLILRNISDLDILVEKQDFLRAKELLIRHGYQHKYFGEHEAAYVQAQLIRDDGLVGVDLHYGITPRDFLFTLDTEPFWEHLTSLSLAGKTVPNLSVSDALLVACVQPIKENWKSFKRICDIAELCKLCTEKDWQVFFEEMQKLGNEKTFLVSLIMAHHLLEISLPKEVSEKIRVLPSLKSTTLEISEQFFSETPNDSDLSINWGKIQLLRMSLYNNQNQIKYLAFVAFNINEKDKLMLPFPLPKYLYFLYYPLRLFRLLLTYKIGLKDINL
ncbi:MULTISPECIES: nucleotidyltransferase family protein [unclassified Nodularia (in: cyanobacteria)]|uniref:nucleotidyltransferase domain-containing protein n=1 Tax=unclassified Nodularia (in: cyanobacteria) TaxID=2656917 RepID=UPI00187E8DE7|nr:MULTISPECIES: nucleotidyltransferase family protein [unclassified Nodularia (in: cyanobacteria)]MBE9198379.1 nucleotidyltransferase family protein [Nodularia sp. LEGE 06071]MCC2691156.1 nucleotidyltransferase family protein [Nodularia sp. LEGE 04288]